MYAFGCYSNTFGGHMYGDWGHNGMLGYIMMGFDAIPTSWELGLNPS